MRKITLLSALLCLVVTQLAISQETFKRITIRNASPNTFDQLIDEGIDLRCGATLTDNSIQLELSESEISQIAKRGIAYTVDIEDLTKFYRDRAQRELPAAIRQLELEKSRSSSANYNERASISSVITDNYLQYHGCDEKDWAVPVNFNLGSMGGCLTYAEAYSEMDAMHALYPNLISARQDASPTNQKTWGNTQGTTTWSGQTIYYQRITGDQSSPEGSKPQLLHTSMIHSREVSALMGNIYYMWYLLENYDTDPAIKNLVDNNEIYFVPIVNPDGLRWNQHVSPGGGAMQRKNLRANTGGTSNSSTNRGVDLNRNFDYFWGSAGTGSSGTTTSDSYRGPSAASEPETQIMVDFILSRNFKTAVWQHTYANGIPHPYGGNPSFISGREDEMHKWHEDMTKYNRYVSGATIFTPANGIADDWMIGGNPDANGSIGSGQNVLATTPESGHGSEGGFWPSPSNIVPIAKRMVRINLMNDYYGGKYAKFHDLTQSDISTLTSDLTFGIERVGQTASDFTLTVTPISANITSITSPSTQTGMSVLEQRNVTAQLILDPSIAANDKIEYNVTLEDDNGNIFYEVNIEKYYQPNIIFSDNPDTDGISNWTVAGNWITTTADAWSNTTAIKNGNVSSYPNNNTSHLTSNSSFDFSSSNEVLIQFYSKWDVERNFDFVELLASTDGGSNWNSLCGKYNKPNSASTTNDAHGGKNSTSRSFQASNSSGMVYDGDQFDNWIMEEIVINASNNSYLLNASNVTFRFRFRSDGGNLGENYSANFDGFYFDDFKIIGLQIPCETTVPTGISVATTTVSANVTWDNIPSATYDLRYREIGAPTWIEVTDIPTNNYVISSLTASTDYEVQVATRCTSTTSAYSTSTNFTTDDIVPCTGTTIVSYPYTETWNSNIGDWSQGTGDDGDWTYNSGATGSGQTGPNSDFSGSGSYFYTEASTTDLGSNATVYLDSPCFDLTGYENANFSFYYHMYGIEMGDLSLEVSTDNGNNWNNLTTISGGQQTANGDPWLIENVPLNLFDGQVIKLRFVGTTGGGYRSDISIDQLNLTADVAGSAPPSAVCQDISVQLDNTGNATIVAADVDGGSSDDVAITNYSIDINTFDCSNIGTPVSVTLTVTDGDGQTDNCTATVTVTAQDEPTAVNCWDNYVYNNTTCLWENQGTQPAEPTTECWETATFNNTTCSWDVTGTQPVEPTTECWETATFNNTTCSWDVTGTQPAEPTTECWETATFNNTTCSWDVT
ncbi:MAG: hypothetical protein GYB32_12300, partial [Algicola sp.]|nr:hypothetical protein [Algicola sp.]